MPITTSDVFPQVRAAIDITLTEDVLPDTIIEMAIYYGAAELEVQRQVPTWEDLDEDSAELQHLVNAVVYLTAARLVMAIPQLTAERSIDGQTYNRKITDPVVLAAELRSLAATEVATVLTPTDEITSAGPLFFTVARGTRGF